MQETCISGVNQPLKAAATDGAFRSSTSSTRAGKTKSLPANGGPAEPTSTTGRPPSTVRSDGESGRIGSWGVGGCTCSPKGTALGPLAAPGGLDLVFTSEGSPPKRVGVLTGESFAPGLLSCQ